MTSSAMLWQRLQNAGLVAGDQPILENNEQPAFFLRVLLGASGWLSALFFCSFISAFFINFLAEANSIWGLGVVLCIASIAISRQAHISLFLQQFVFACSITGQGFIVFGVFDSSDSGQFTAAVLLVLEMTLFVAIGIRSQRATAIFIACVALLWLLGEQFWLYVLPLLSAAAAWLWLHNWRLYKHRAYFQPAAVGLTCALWLSILAAIMTNSTEFFGVDITPEIWHAQLWGAAALTSLVCLMIAWQMIQSSVQHPQLRYLALFIGIAIGLLNLKMLGIAPLCLLLCIGVIQAHSRLIWFNLLALVVYLLLYYYNLNNTLLYKSILLCISGSVLLLLYAVLNCYVSPLITEPKAHA